jgi:hypothetical protein
MMPGMPKKRTHDYVRHGVTSLFAAFNIADGTVISAIHRRHWASEFKKFLATIDVQVPDLDVRLICDNYGPTRSRRSGTGWSNIPGWPSTSPRPAPVGSTRNQVERWFGFLTDELIRRGNHASVQALEADIRAWIRRTMSSLPLRPPGDAWAPSPRAGGGDPIAHTDPHSRPLRIR